MLPKQPVNRTKLHPHGVKPPAKHTKIEEELKDQANIDYDHVNIQHNPSIASLYEDTLVYESGSAITSTGALATSSGIKTGRSPEDKRIVLEASSSELVWWGPFNKPISESVWQINRERAIDYLNTRSRIYVCDGYAGWDERYRIKVRVVCARAYHCLFMRNMLIRPTEDQRKTYGHPDFTIYNAGSFPANRYTAGMTSTTTVDINFAEHEMVILGTEYAGEMKKGILTVMSFLMPVKHNILTLHSSANQGKNGDVTLFFGLSDTGKTTLSADANRALIGDDEHCWSDYGLFNIEGGGYAKCIGLSEETAPEIFNAIHFGAVLENVVFDPVKRAVDYNDASLTENTRCAYPIENIPNAKIPCVSDHPKNIILLTCDARGVLPLVSKLDNNQVMYHFISGYTSKVIGGEENATFNSSFGQPFVVLHPTQYAQMLSDKVSRHSATAWLINTGWVGHSVSKGGKRCPLKYTRAILDAIHDGTLAQEKYVNLEVFNLQIPVSCASVPSDLLHPAKAWIGIHEEYQSELHKLAQEFQHNFEKYHTQTPKEVIVILKIERSLTD